MHMSEKNTSTSCSPVSPAENALLEDDNTFHLVRQPDEIDEVKSKRGSMKDKAMTKAITEIYLTRLLSVKVQLCSFTADVSVMSASFSSRNSQT